MIPGAPFHADVAAAPEGAEGWWLTAGDGTRLRAVVWRQGTRGTAVIFPGRTEYAEKYGPVAGELVARGFAVAVIDWRGQGLSDRHPRNTMLGHVRDFADYQQDVAALMALVAALEMPGPLCLVAHSMGGCIAMRTLVERQDFESAILSAPMWGLHLGAATQRVAVTLAAIAGRVGFGERRMPGTGGLRSPAVPPFAGNVLTSDAELFAWGLAQVTRYPELALGQPSIGWTHASFRETARLAAGPLPNLPMLVLVGTGEVVVSPAAIRDRARRMPRCAVMALEGGRHEVLMERPEIREAVWRRIDDFLAEVPAQNGRAAAARG